MDTEIIVHELQGYTSSSTTTSATTTSMARLSLNISRIGATFFTMLACKPRHKLFSVNLRDLNRVLDPPWKPALNINVDPTTFVLPEYYEFLDVFSQKNSEQLPSFGEYDYHIHLKEGTKPPYGPLYDMSRKKNEELCKYLLENLEKGFIKTSKSPAASLVLFILKPQGGLQFCVNY